MSPIRLGCLSLTDVVWIALLCLCLLQQCGLRHSRCDVLQEAMARLRVSRTFDLLTEPIHS